MNADERLNLIRIKIERAKELIRELENEVQLFIDSKPFVVGTKRDPQTRRLIYYVVSVREPPGKLAAITGDVIQNLRSGLDHLAYQLVIVGTENTPSNHIYFPIADNAEKYQSQRSDKVKGMRTEAVEAIDALKPYKDGNDILWQIHNLNIVDKHRLLLTVGSAYRSVNLGAHMSREMQRLWSSDPKNSDVTFPSIDAFFRPADRKFPLEPEDVLFIDGTDADVNPQLQFRFEVAFGEPQIIEGMPLVETLKQMADYVDGVVTNFTQFLA